MSTHLPSVLQAKDQARRLREKLAEDGTKIGHAKSLELVARQHGFNDWNAMCAALEDRPLAGWAVGDKVTGSYLSQRFTAEVVSVSLVQPGWFRLVLHLDTAVDVVTFDGFSNFRRRIRGVVGPKGHSVERTSDGQVHLQIDL
ncbi:MAG: glyoxalase superfamily protein [Thalassovita sp.]